MLFDTGADPVLQDNLRLLNVNPAVIEAVVLSHYHLDHTWGVPGIGPLPGVRVFTPHGFEAHPKETALLESARLTLVAVEEMKPLFEGITISEPLLFKGKIPFGVPGRAELSTPLPEPPVLATLGWIEDVMP